MRVDLRNPFKTRPRPVRVTRMFAFRVRIFNVRERDAFDGWVLALMLKCECLCSTICVARVAYVSVQLRCVACVNIYRCSTTILIVYVAIRTYTSIAIAVSPPTNKKKQTKNSANIHASYIRYSVLLKIYT